MKGTVGLYHILGEETDDSDYVNYTDDNKE